MNKLKEKNAITLIALVITIIVMLILVAVTINIAVNGGLFSYAGKEARDTEIAKQEEQEIGKGDIIDYYLYTKPEVMRLKEYKNATKDNETSILKENARYGNNGKQAVIPKGFRLTNKTDEQSIDNGLVIEDASGNQFVWVPVKDEEFIVFGWWNNEPTNKTIDEICDELTEEEKRDYLAKNYGYNTMEEMIEDNEYETYEEVLISKRPSYLHYTSTDDWFKNVFGNYGYPGSSYIDNSENDITGQYNNMIESVKKFGGFYIGRFEAGTDIKRTNNSPVSSVFIQKGKYPYNHVVWGASSTEIGTSGAVYLSSNLYTDNNTYGVISTLCYDIQWDATLRFIKDEADVCNSVAWGNCRSHEFEYVGEYGTYSYPNVSWTTNNTETTKPLNTSYLLQTGASEENKVKNIYDLAGNVQEWTIKCSGNTSQPFRGGCFDLNTVCACHRGGNTPFYPSNSLGFRPTLYIV